MKQLAFIALLALFAACSTPVKHNTQMREENTVITAAINLNANQFATTAAKRLIKDTFKLSVVDSTGGEIHQKKAWVTDTTYIIPWPDTLRDKSGAVLRDSAGKYQMTFRWIVLPRELMVQDFNHNWK